MGILVSVLFAGYGGYKLGEKLDKRYDPICEPFKIVVPVIAVTCLFFSGSADYNIGYNNGYQAGYATGFQDDLPIL